MVAYFKESWRYIKTDVMMLTESLNKHANRVENKFSGRLEKLEVHIKEIEKRLNRLKK